MKLARHIGFFILSQFFLILSFPLATLAASPQTIDVDKNFQHLYLGDKLIYKADAQAQSYQEAANSLSENPDQWGLLQDKTFGQAIEKNHWFSFRISNRSQENTPLIVNFDYAWLWDYTLYVLDDDGQLLQSYTSGNRYIFSERPVQNRTFNMPVMLDSDTNLLVLIKAEGQLANMHDFLNLYAEDVFYHQFEVRERGIWLYYGVMLVMVFYNLMLFLVIKEKIYLSFSLFIVSILGMYFASNGHAFELLWPNSPWLQHRSSVLFSLLVMITLVDFYRRLLNTRTHLPRFNIFAYVLQGISALLFIYFLFMPPRENMSIINTIYFLFAIFFTLSLVNSIYLQFWRKIREAKYFSFSFGIFVVMAVAYILQDVNYISANVITLYGVYIGQAIMVVILSLALADRVNALESARQYAEAESITKSEILAKMSHEIRTPMNGVLGMSELLATTDLNVCQRNYNDAIFSSGSTLLEIINDILDFSKIEAGKMELAQGEFDLEKRALETLEMFRHKAAEKGLELMLDYDASTPQQFYGDPVRIQQIIINYLSNALKFTEEGEVVLRIASLSSTRIRIEVLDTGVGIDEKNVSKLFQAFNQADAWVAKNYGGTGLGLAICKQLAQLMDGEVGVETSVGKGSLFYAELELEATGNHQQEGSNKGELLRGKRALIVDGNSNYVTRTLKQLNSWGMYADSVCSADKALEELQAAKEQGSLYDVISLNLKMEESTALIEKIRQDDYWQQTALLLLTATLEKSDIKMGSSDSMVMRTTKPFQVDALYPLYCECCGFCVVKDREVKKSGDSGVFCGSGMRVLVAEDNLVNQQVMSAMLKHLGLDFVIAPDGKKALEHYSASLDNSEGCYSFILMDCEMPEMDGFEATKKIRLLEKHRGISQISIYALTAHAVQEYVDRCYAAGMDGCITKPVAIDTLVNIFKKWRVEQGV